MRVRISDDLREAIINGTCDSNMSVTDFTNGLLRSALRANTDHSGEIIKLLKEALFAQKFVIEEGDAEARHLREKVLAVMFSDPDDDMDSLRRWASNLGDFHTLEAVLAELYATGTFDKEYPGKIGLVAHIMEAPIGEKVRCPCCGERYIKDYGSRVTCNDSECREWLRKVLINQAKAAVGGVA